MFKIPKVVVLRSGALRETSYKDLSPSNKSFREFPLLSHLHLCHLTIQGLFYSVALLALLCGDAATGVKLKTQSSHHCSPVLAP